MLLRYILKRILIMIPTLIVTSALIFTVINLPEGDYFETLAAEMQAQGEKADLSRIEFLKREYGFDKPPVERYFHWVAGLLQGGDRKRARLQRRAGRVEEEPVEGSDPVDQQAGGEVDHGVPHPAAGQIHDMRSRPRQKPFALGVGDVLRLGERRECVLVERGDDLCR